MKKIVFFDLDGTLIDNPSSEKLYFLWLLFRGQVGIKQIIAIIKFTFKWTKKFGMEVIVKNKAYLYNKPTKETIKQATTFTKTHLLKRLRPYVVARLKKHQADGDTVILLTGSPYFIANVFAKHLGITEVEATQLVISNDRFSDLPPTQLPFAKEKLVVVKRVCAKYNTDVSQSVSYANSIHDLILMEKVGVAVAVTPDRKFRQIALRKNWEII